MIKNKILYIFILLSFLVIFSTQSFALCESASNAKRQLKSASSTMKIWTEKFVREVTNFIKLDLETAQNEMTARLGEFDINFRNALEEWWVDAYRPSLMQISKQLDTAEVEQTRSIGSFIDANNQNIVNRSFMVKEVEEDRRVRPSEISCQADTVSFAINNAERFANTIGNTIANTSISTLTQKTKGGLTSELGGLGNVDTADGPGAEHAAKWDEYKTYFCDPKINAGHSGCINPGLLPNKDMFLGELLWGEKKTIDLSRKENRILVDRMLRNIIMPVALPIIPESALDSETGRRFMLNRRSYFARQQTIYNVLSRMVGLRAATNPDIADKIAKDSYKIRENAGIKPDLASHTPSYYETMETMTRDRFRHTRFGNDLINEPENLVRENITIQAFQLQQMNDIYKRNEELLLLLAADLAVDLDDIPLPDVTENASQN